MSVTITPQRDWRRPIASVAEETYWADAREDGSSQPRRAIRWHVSAEGLERIRSKMACWDCLTPFPAPPAKANWATWRASGFRWHPVFGLAGSRKLIEAGCCPICKSEVSDEMLAVQMDEEWTAEDAMLKAGAAIRLEDERERFDHADEARARRLGLVEPVAPPSRRKSAKRRGES